MSTAAEWIIDTTTWPGGKRFSTFAHDLIVPSTTGNYAAVLYNIDEVAMNWLAGRLAILAKPCDKPRVIYQPRRLLLWAEAGGPAIWLQADRYLAVQAYETAWITRRISTPAVFLDVSERLVAFHAVNDGSTIVFEDYDKGTFRVRESFRNTSVESIDGQIIDPGTLPWRPW